MKGWLWLVFLFCEKIGSLKNIFYANVLQKNRYNRYKETLSPPIKTFEIHSNQTLSHSEHSGSWRTFPGYMYCMK